MTATTTRRAATRRTLTLGAMALASLLGLAPTGASATKLYFDKGYHQQHAQDPTSDFPSLPSTVLDPNDLLDVAESTDARGCMAAKVGQPVNFPIVYDAAPGSTYAFLSSPYGDKSSPIPGLTMAADGTVTGTPTEAGAGSFQFSMDDGNGDFNTANQCYQVGTDGGPSSLSFDTVYGWWFEPGSYFDIPAPVLHGNTSRVAWTINPALPDGLDFVEGEIFGSTTVVGKWTGAITATDAGGASATTTTFTLDVENPRPKPRLYTDGTCVMTKGPNPQPVNWDGWLWDNKPSGQLSWTGFMPHGLTLDGATGAITGTPGGDYTDTDETDIFVIVSWQDDYGGNSTFFDLCANQDSKQDMPLVVDDPTPKSYQVGAQIDVPPPAAHGGSGHVTWSVEPTPPPGLTFSAGQIAGRLIYAASYPYTLTASDDDGQSVTTYGQIDVHDSEPTAHWDGKCMGTPIYPMKAGENYNFFPYLIKNPDASPATWTITGYTTSMYTEQPEYFHAVPADAYPNESDVLEWITINPDSGMIRAVPPFADNQVLHGALGDTYTPRVGALDLTITVKAVFHDAIGDHTSTMIVCGFARLEPSAVGGGIRG